MRGRKGCLRGYPAGSKKRKGEDGYRPSFTAVSGKSKLHSVYRAEKGKAPAQRNLRNNIHRGVPVVDFPKGKLKEGTYGRKK